MERLDETISVNGTRRFAELPHPKLRYRAEGLTQERQPYLAMAGRRLGEWTKGSWEVIGSHQVRIWGSLGRSRPAPRFQTDKQVAYYVKAGLL